MRSAGLLDYVKAEGISLHATRFRLEYFLFREQRDRHESLDFAPGLSLHGNDLVFVRLSSRIALELDALDERLRRVACGVERVLLQTLQRLRLNELRQLDVALTRFCVSVRDLSVRRGWASSSIARRRASLTSFTAMRVMVAFPIPWASPRAW